MLATQQSLLLMHFLVFSVQRCGQTKAETDGIHSLYNSSLSSSVLLMQVQKHRLIQDGTLVLGWWAHRQLTLVLSLVFSKSCEGKRVPFRVTVAFGSGPDDGGLEVRDSALSCSSRERTIPSPSSSDESRVWAEDRRQEVIACARYAVCCWRTWVCKHLLQEWQVTAGLPEAQQQRQDVDSAGRLLGLLGTRRSRVRLGHAELLGHWGGKTHSLCNKHSQIISTMTKFDLKCRVTPSF